jgi:hypothetical protein
LRKSFPIPVTSKVFPTLSCSNFRVWGLLLRSLIHFEWMLVKDDKHGSSFFFLQMAKHYSQQYLLKKLSFLHPMFLAPLSKIRWVQLCELISRSSILFHWSPCLFLCQYYAVCIAIDL